MPVDHGRALRAGQQRRDPAARQILWRVGAQQPVLCNQLGQQACAQRALRPRDAQATRSSGQAGKLAQQLDVAGRDPGWGIAQQAVMVDVAGTGADAAAFALAALAQVQPGVAVQIRHQDPGQYGHGARARQRRLRDLAQLRELHEPVLRDGIGRAGGLPGFAFAALDVLDQDRHHVLAVVADRAGAATVEVDLLAAGEHADGLMVDRPATAGDFANQPVALPLRDQDMAVIGVIVATLQGAGVEVVRQVGVIVMHGRIGQSWRRSHHYRPNTSILTARRP